MDDPAAFVTTKVTLYVPALLYVTDGFGTVELLGVPPGKSHDQLVTLSDEVLLYITVKGAQPLVVVDVNPPTGSVTIVIVSVVVTEPHSFVAVNTTSYIPSVS